MEKHVASFLGYYRVPYSGAGGDAYGEADVRNHESRESASVLGECKTMTPKSVKNINYIIKEEWLVGPKSIVHRAKHMLGFLAFRKVRSPHVFAIVTIQHFRMLMRAVDILKARGIISDGVNMETTIVEIDRCWAHLERESGSCV